MKKIANVLCLCLLAISLVSCAATESMEISGTQAPPAAESAPPASDGAADKVTEAEQGDQEGESERAEPSGQSGVLVAYFSWADNAAADPSIDTSTSASVNPPGNVAQLAGWIQEETGGDLFPIRVTEPYSSDWDECLDRANREKAEDARPELVERVANIEDYDTIFLGYPNWWYSCPMAIFSFIEQHDLSGKQIYLFCSHGTGGLASSVQDISAALPDAQLSENVFDVYEDDAAAAESDVRAWAGGLE